MLELSATDTRLKTIIGQSGIIGYPTEAVYGIGCHPADTVALNRLISSKGRDADKGFILIAATLAQLAPYIAIDSDTENYLQTIYPGFVTVIVSKSANCPPLLSGSHSGIAIRISAHPLVATLCQTLGHPLVSTSANISGQPPITDKALLIQTFGDKLDALVSGDLGDEQRPSKIIDLTTSDKRIIRE